MGTARWSGNASEDVDGDVDEEDEEDEDEDEEELIGAQIGAGDWRRSCRGVLRGIVGLVSF